ncbi:MAG: non-canonical purine NTP diphosphatase [Bacteroidales bacterium]|nr:non-canonical purine NTP diphosphatase [Bacteroidales bacterium]
MQLVFATHNRHKLDEVQSILGTDFKLLSLSDIHCVEDIPETSDTLEGNALEKARYVHAKYGLDCFADDTGLEIKSLNNRPGVYSARYAGESCNFDDNMNKVLQELQGVSDRSARFRTLVALIWKGKEHIFEGIIEGNIISSKKGGEGFGYDPIFQPNTYDITFAEMEMSEKNRISHRGLATAKLVDFLKKQIL